MTKVAEEIVTKTCAELELARQLGELVDRILLVTHEFPSEEEQKEFIYLVDRLREMINSRAIFRARMGFYSTDDTFLQKVDDTHDQLFRDIFGEDHRKSELMKELRRLT